MSAYDKTPLDNNARMLPESNDSECPANKNAQQPQIEIGSKLHDGEAAAFDKCFPDECVDRGKGHKAGIGVDVED